MDFRDQLVPPPPSPTPNPRHGQEHLSSSFYCFCCFCTALKEFWGYFWGSVAVVMSRTAALSVQDCGAVPSTSTAKASLGDQSGGSSLCPGPRYPSHSPGLQWVRTWCLSQRQIMGTTWSGQVEKTLTAHVLMFVVCLSEPRIAEHTGCQRSIKKEFHSLMTKRFSWLLES